MQQLIGEGGKEKAILQQMVTGGAVEAIGSSGPDRSAENNRALLAVFDHIRAHTSFDTLAPEDIAAGRTTRIVFAQMSAVPPNLAGDTGKTDIAMCMTFRAGNVQSDGGDGQLAAIVTLTPEGFKNLYPLIHQKPETAYALLRIANHGMIRAKDGISPATILAGDKVRMMPNIGMGGKLNQVVESMPFPASFNPNPIY